MCLLLIRTYQILLSPTLGGSCRFHPSCSEYAIEAFKNRGFIEAFKLTFIRLSKCRPGGGFGFDPLPDCCGVNLGDHFGSESR